MLLLHSIAGYYTTPESLLNRSISNDYAPTTQRPTPGQ